MRHADSFPKARISQGFTLLEIMLAMFVFALLVSSIVAIVSGTTQLADEMEKGHERDSQSHSFAQLCERTLRRLPAQAQVRLKVKQSGKQYLSQLAILNAPSILGSGAGGGNGLTILETDQQPDGYMRVLLKLVGAQDVAAYETAQAKTGASLVLLNDVARCEWKFFNPASNEWETNWNATLVFTSPQQSQPLGQPPPTPPGPPQTPPAANGAPPSTPGLAMTGTGTLILSPSSQRPTLIELTLALRAEPPRRFLFWVPSAQVPGNTPASHP